jgi:hypothetical protein
MKAIYETKGKAAVISKLKRQTELFKCIVLSAKACPLLMRLVTEDIYYKNCWVRQSRIKQLSKEQQTTLCAQCWQKYFEEKLDD